jgi:hypothetical protein
MIRPARPHLAFATTAVAVSLLAAPAAQPEADELELLLNRLGNYLLAYETALTTVIASERYEQQELRSPRRRATLATLVEVARQRTLQSDVAFLRLPDGSSWLGVRDVREVNGRAVVNDEKRLAALVRELRGNRLAAGDERWLDDAARIVAASALYNLGTARTINMPTTPLAVLHPDHHVQFIFKLHGRDKIGGVMTSRIDFEEFDVPTLVNTPDGDPLFIHGSAWIEPANGRLWRAQLQVRPGPDARVRPTLDNGLRVDFAYNAELQMLVPKEMTEEFYVIGGRGVGKAKYSNYRRFTTSARVVPQD